MINESTTNRIILGIDPGTTHMGYAIISVLGKKVDVLTLGALHLAKLENHPLKLKRIFEKVIGLIEAYHPDELAIEAPFFGKNVQSMLKLGRAQGVAMAAALSREVPLTEYAPKRIKQSITGNGNASKEQVAAMLTHLLGMSFDEERLDATDALSVAYCHYLQSSNPLSAYKSGGWEAFIRQNPDRIK
jgi:crossover junction endodeoxyribonuclease RuvC